jgi:hypothetical protein
MLFICSMPRLGALVCVALVTTVSSCKRTVDTTEQHGACEHVVSRYKELDTTKGVFASEPPAIQKELEPVLVERRNSLLDACTADAWSADAIACFTAAADFVQATECASRLSPEQRRAVERAEQDLDTKMEAAAVRIVDHEMVGVKALLERMCACTDATCADAVAAERAKITTPGDFFLKTAYAKADERLAQCRSAASCDEISCTMDPNGSPCCAKLHAAGTKPAKKTR